MVDKSQTQTTKIEKLPETKFIIKDKSKGQTISTTIDNK